KQGEGKRTGPASRGKPARRWSQLDRLDFLDEGPGVAVEEAGDRLEDGVAEAADVEHVGLVRRLRRGARLDVDADELRVATQAGLTAGELTPLGQHAGRLAAALADPALVVADQHDAGELVVLQPRVGAGQRQ